MAYAQPAKGESFAPRDNPDWKGKLFVIYPVSIETVQFVNKTTGQVEPSDIVTADVLICDLIDPETQRPKVLKGARIGGKALVPAIKGLVGTGDATVGRLKQLPANGQKSGAFILDEHTDAELAIATQTEAANPNWRGGHAQPAAAAAPTGGASAPAATPTPAAAPAAAGAPWYATDTALLTKLISNGVANAVTLDYAVAQQIGASFA